MIYSPQRRQGRDLGGPRWDAVSADHPLRCVLYHGKSTAHPEAVAWLAAMEARYDLRRTERIVLDMANRGGPPLNEMIVVFEFAPKPGAAVVRSAPPGALRR
jgi:hypothetical protein